MKLLLKWSPVALFIAIWTGGWWIAWEVFIFDWVAIEAPSGAELFNNDRTSQRTLWGGMGATIVLGVLGFLFLLSSSAFEMHSRTWSRVWIGIGSFLILIGLSTPILIPSAESLVVDREAQTVSLDRAWLYTDTHEVLPFGDIKRIGLRVRRTLVGGFAKGCQVATGLSIIRTDRTWLEVPGGFDHERIAEIVATTSGKTLESLGTREC